MTDSRDTEPAGLRRRRVLRGAAAGALALGFGPLAGEAQAATYMKGADISWMPQMEANGHYWNNSAGVRQDLFTILKGYGITAVSLRTWGNPSDSPDNGHCGIDETAQLAKRAKDAGMQVLIGFHIGDTWNSVGVQNPPAAWVKIGNETNSGICKPVGSISNPDRMTGLLNAAYDMS
ncbi:glycosyl hydrolase 53 family protein [Streptomyces justiciae]|uniref:Arabinogalactan endo-beta-1,4-galactanase n=1 Tax=Streptomyces justiciae TaxID=2780140 RepID=A0ABU3LTZ2_9ACTN|nr:glycosyl hydrolase 53 family protein [Streptomyces justiciae]MDT7842013.1 glycosyl hydrolase 53 family protein [Streptomyces justiciae]